MRPLRLVLLLEGVWSLRVRYLLLQVFVLRHVLLLHQLESCLRTVFFLRVNQLRIVLGPIPRECRSRVNRLSAKRVRTPSHPPLHSVFRRRRQSRRRPARRQLLDIHVLTSVVLRLPL